MKYSFGKKADGKKRNIVIGIICGCLILVVGALGFFFIHHVKSSNSPSPSVVKSHTYAYKNVSGTYLFSGTIMLGRAVETYAAGNYEQPFSELNTLGKYDARIGVLECPITSQNVSYQIQVASLKFNCKPAWLPYLKKYYPIVNVSSNHLYDMGEDGFNETVQRLKSAGFQVVGNYNPHIEKDNCKPVILPVKLQKTDGTEVSGKLPVAICSYNYKELFSPEPGEIESITKWSKKMPVIALLNGGPEYEHAAGVAQVSNAHKMIDAGASFVIGNGTHWAQNTEIYKGKLIVYSMGNFIFDQYDTDGILALNVAVKMTVPYTNNVAKWLRVGDSCSNNPASCLDTVNSQKLQLINPSFTFKPVTSSGGYLAIVHKADPEQQKYIESRANWAATEQKLYTQKSN